MNALISVTRKLVIVVLLSVLVFGDFSPLLQWPPAPPSVPTVAAAEILPAIRIETFDEDVTTDGSTFTLDNDVGDTDSAFIRMNTGTRKTSAGPTGSTGNANPNVGTVGLVLSDTATVTVERVDPTEVKVMGEVWRYEGFSGGSHEFIVRDRVAISLGADSASQSISGISDVDKVIPFITGYTVDDASLTNWEAATIAAHMDDSANLVVSRNNSVTAATVYVDVVEFTGSAWTVCHGYSNGHDTAEQTITLDTDPDGQGGSTCDVTDWETATIIEATMEGDSVESGLSDTLALVRPGANTTSVVFDLQQDAGARNDGEAWMHVLQNDGLVVTRESDTNLAEGDGTYGSASWPSGATTTVSTDLLSLEWFTDTSGVGTAHMRGGLHARITEPEPTTYSDNDLVPATDYDSAAEGNFTADISFAASPEGVVYEAGGTGTGSMVGYNDSGDFIVRAGSGASVSPSDAARIVVTASDYDFSSRTGLLEWNFYPDTEAVDLSFDEDANGSIDYATSTTADTAWANWSGGDDGGVGTSNGSLAGSEITSAFNFNGTINEVRFSQNSGADTFIEHWIHRSGNTVGVEYGVIELAGLKFDNTFFGFDTLVTATSTHSATATIPATNEYVGGTFIIAEGSATRNVTSIAITESGTIDASTDLSDIELWYDVSTSAPYDCSEHSYDGNETQFGSTDSNGFSGANGISSFTDAAQISTSKSLCVYPVMSIEDGASDGQTIAISIADASIDVSASGGSSVGSQSYPQAINGNTTVQNAELTQTHYRWLADDGVEGSATALDAEDTSIIGFSNGTTRRLRLQVDAAGSIASPATTFQLDYATKTAACNTLTTWIDVGESGGDWDMSASGFVTDGANSTNISTVNGGLSDPAGPPTYLSPNGALRDNNSQTGALTLSSDEFVEFEFAIEPTTIAPEGNTYCFRLSDSGTQLRNYDTYAEGTISADFEASSNGSHIASVDAGATGQYLGGTFILTRPSGSNENLTDITITERGTIDAQTNLDNIEVWYDIDASPAYDCSAESYNGDEIQFGATDTDGFSGPDGTSSFSDSVSVRTNRTFCGYVVVDVSSGAINGDTVAFEISDPASDISVPGFSVGPSTAIGPTSSTTVSGSILTQTGYHWRNDDDTEADATSATGDVENTPLLDVPRDTTYRLRYQVDNEGAVNSVATAFQLEYGTKISSCENIASWQAVDVGAAFTMASTSQLIEGNDTTDVGTGGVTNPGGQTFLGTNGGQKEDDDTTGAVTLSSAQFTELEYALQATDQSGFETDYCFRLSDGGTALSQYPSYAELTTREQQDFFIQRGTQFVTGTSTVLQAGVDYTAPAATSTAFIRLTGSQITGSGHSVEGTQEAKDVTAYIEDQSDITSRVVIARPSAAVNSTRVDWEIVEYVGLSGADNEVVVRDSGTITYGGGDQSATGTAVSAVSDDRDIVVFITGQVHPDAGVANYLGNLSTSRWSTSTSQPVFERETSSGGASGVSYAVVEFVGLNWKIQRIEHNYAVNDSVEQESITPVGSVARTFLHVQKRAGDVADNGLNDYGHEVWLPSIGSLSFRIIPESGGTGDPAEHYSVVWLVENTQTGDGALEVYRISGSLDNDETIEPRITSVPIGITLLNTTNTSLSINNLTTGDGTAFPRPMLGATIASTTHIELFESDTGQTESYRVEVIVWPVARTALRQNYYRLYVDNDALDPVDPWPVGAEDLGENTSVTGGTDPMGEGERMRIRMSMTVSNVSLPAETQAYKLQFARRITSCSALETWTDLGNIESGAVWRGYNTSVVDGTNLATSTPAVGTLNISVSDIAGTFEEENDTAVNPYAVDIGQDVEYDWVVEHNGATQLSDYCFRMVNANDTILDGYNNYPTVRTSGYTPVISNWRWYDDATSTTPSNPLAGEEVTPIDISLDNEIKLRVVASESEGAPGSAVKFKLQYSESSDFSVGVYDVVSTTTCANQSTSTANLWCYANAAAEDNAVIDTALLTNADSCVAGTGDGCGTHNEAATTSSTHTQPSLSNMEYEFTLRNDGARANAVYYFRLYDVTNDVAIETNSSYPSLQVEGASLSLSVAGVGSGTNSEGVIADITTTATSLPFGTVPIATQYEAIYRLSVDTNATQGYQLFMYATQPLSNVYGEQIPDVAASNSAPSGWATACVSVASGCFGYHSGDDVLFGGSTRFAADDSYAAISTGIPEEIMHSSVPIEDTVDIVFKMEITQLQPAGDYESEIVYLAVPSF
ncbi:hypothetical protein N9L26_00200 [Candidatus Pacebacteria bacterium]|nr:hypothetical protein [Candidatus Paceibacterota bacterium]